MPLPLILGLGAAIAGLAGVGSGIRGGVKMKEASDTVKEAQRRNTEAQEELEHTNELTIKAMDQLGEFELQIVKSFEEFSENWEKIQNKPKFDDLDIFDDTLPEYDMGEIKEVSTAANVALGALGGASVGVAGGFAASGATTAAVMALGTASTGTAISTLSGAAATNAALAALGGGSIAAGGGGMALGSAILGGATLGVGLLIGGAIFNLTGSKMTDKADAAYGQMLDTEEKVEKICKELRRIKTNCYKYIKSLTKVNDVYMAHLWFLEDIISQENTDWKSFSFDDVRRLKNLVLLVQLLYSMCGVKIVVRNPDEYSDVENVLNKKEVTDSMKKADEIIAKI